MCTLINASPKPINSNSSYFLNLLSDHLNKFCIYNLKKDKYEDILENIKLSDVIVLSFPLYVDCPTSLMLEFLDYIYDNNINISNKKLYVVINCGFREGKQNITALNIIKNWCNKNNLLYSGSILIGAGEIVGKSKYKVICRSALKKLSYFSNKVSQKQNCEDIITTMDYLNNKIYVLLANKNWNKRCKKNKLTKEIIKKI